MPSLETVPSIPSSGASSEFESWAAIFDSWLVLGEPWQVLCDVEGTTSLLGFLWMTLIFLLIAPLSVYVQGELLVGIQVAKQLRVMLAFEDIREEVRFLVVTYSRQGLKCDPHNFKCGPQRGSVVRTILSAAALLHRSIKSSNMSLWWTVQTCIYGRRYPIAICIIIFAVRNWVKVLRSSEKKFSDWQCGPASAAIKF